MQTERRFIELHGPTVTQGYRRVGKVRVGKDAIDAGRAAGHDAGAGQEPFLRVAERMSAAARNILEVMAVDLQPRLLGQESLDGGVVYLEDFGLDEGRFRSHRGRQLNHLLLHALVRADSRVLIGIHTGVYE